MIALATFAAHERLSLGRRYQEPPPQSRSEYQRDRDRIVHSTAFRRLEYKTQVFVNHEGDLFRTRLTHTIEVAQISRSVARALNLNEDLAEAIALAHDVGHTPFGHAGQDALNACMQEYGGFEHNIQSLRIVDELEEHYAAFNGLNLTYEAREGILKHCSRANAAQLGELGRRFIEGGQPSLEAQLTNLADEIAYNNHDIDDGLRSGFLTLEQLESVAIFSASRRDVERRWPNVSGRRLIHETVRSMVNAMALDLIEQTSANIFAAGVETLAEVRQAACLVTHSDHFVTSMREMKRFLHENLYRHYQVVRMTTKAQRIVSELFDAFVSNPRLLPPQYQRRANNDKTRTVADYIAGMTDRYATKEYRRIFEVSENH